MHLKDIAISNSFTMTGKGKALVTNLNYDTDHHRFNKGDTIRHECKIYEIISIEALNSQVLEKKRDLLVFVSREITVKDLLKKSASKKPSSWMKKADWRAKNEWWIRPWNWLKIKYLTIKRKFKKK